MPASPQSPPDDLAFESLDPAYRAFCDDHLRCCGFEPARFCRPLPGRDEMFFKAILPNYEHDASIAAFKFVESAMRLHDGYRQIVETMFGGFDRLGTVLDFASGWGRLTRVLTQRLKPEQIFVADIYHEAVAWQSRVFGVRAVPSAPRPSDLAHETRHDLIFVGSMFSHLPDPLFRAWMKRLYGLLTPRGVLAFSVHDVALLPAGATPDPGGITYLRFSESDSLDAEIYGMSYVTEAYVGGAIGALGAPPPGWKRFPKAAYENQDLYVVGAPGVDLGPLRVAASPMGGLESLTHLPNGAVELAGWSIERTPQEAIARIVAVADGRELAAATPAGARPDVLDHFPGAANPPLGWRLRLRADAAPPGALVRLQIESTSGLVGYAYLQMPPPAAMTYAGWSRRSLREA